MTEMTCPHCHTGVPHGATVCRGCQAEVEYGTPQFFYLFAFLFAVFCGVVAGGWLPDPVKFLGWFAFFGVLVASYMFASAVFKNRIVFKRQYNTRS